MIGQQSAIGDESARWFVDEGSGEVRLLSISRDGRVTTLPHQPTLEEYPNLSAPLREQIARHMRGTAWTDLASPAS